jgi:PST family polysaccharide transporter
LNPEKGDVGSGGGLPIERRVRVGIRATGMAQLCAQFISLVTLMVLYRWIPPEDYGLLGMVLPVLLLLRIAATLGLNVTAVQRSHLSAAEASALFWWNIGLGAVISAVTVLASPLLASFYGQPALWRLTAVLAGTSFVSCLGTIHQALLEREMRLGLLAWVRLAGHAAGVASAIPAALAGWRIWALVLQQYMELLVIAALLWGLHPWRPGWPSRSPPVGHHLRAGGYYSAAHLLLFAAGSLDKVWLGRVAGERVLGFYSQAYGLMTKPVFLITTPLLGMVLTALSRAAGDRRLGRQLLRDFYRLLGVFLLPVGIGLVAVGDQAMLLLGGTAWAPAGSLLAVLSLAIPALGLVYMTVPVFSAVAGTKRLFVTSLGMLAVLIPSWWIGWQVAGVARSAAGFAWASALAMALVIAPLSTIYCLRCAGQRPSEILSVWKRPLVASLAMGAAVAVLRVILVAWTRFTPTSSLAVEVLAGMIIYTLLAGSDVRWLMAHWFGHLEHDQRTTSRDRQGAPR